MSHTSAIKVLVADDHCLFREAIGQILNLEGTLLVVGEAADGEEAAERCGRLQPHVMLLDLAMPRLSGIEVLAQTRDRSPNTAVVLLTAEIGRQQLFEALLLGVRGVILKSALTETLIECIHAVAAGGYWFTPGTVTELVTTLRAPMAPPQPAPRLRPIFTDRERQIVSAVMEGESNAEIGRAFGLCAQTVKNHLTKIFDKAGVSTRVELALYALDHGMGRVEISVSADRVGNPTAVPALA